MRLRTPLAALGRRLVQCRAADDRQKRPEARRNERRAWARPWQASGSDRTELKIRRLRKRVIPALLPVARGDSALTDGLRRAAALAARYVITVDAGSDAPCQCGVRRWRYARRIGLPAQVPRPHPTRQWMPVRPTHQPQKRAEDCDHRQHAPNERSHRRGRAHGLTVHRTCLPQRSFPGIAQSRS